MIILAFRVNDFAQFPGAIKRAHGVQIFVETGRFEHHVIPAAGLHRRKQTVRFFQRPEYCRHGAGHVFAVFQGLDAVPRVARRIGRNEDGLYPVVLNQLFQGRIGLRTPARFRQSLATVWNQVADRDHLDIGMRLETEIGAEPAHAVANNAHADLAVGHGFPAFSAFGRVGRSFESLDRRLCGTGELVRSESRCAQPGNPQE